MKKKLELSDEEQVSKLYTRRKSKKTRKKPVGTITFGNIINEDIATNFHGFIYIITFLNGDWYLGKKAFELGEHWTTYKSSSKQVKERLKTEQATFQVLFYCSSKGELSYRETKELFSRNALEDPRSLNENIAGRFFKKNIQRYPRALKLDMSKADEIIAQRKELLERLKDL